MTDVDILAVERKEVLPCCRDSQLELDNHLVVQGERLVADKLGIGVAATGRDKMQEVHLRALLVEESLLQEVAESDNWP